MALEVEGIVDGGMNAQKVLRRAADLKRCILRSAPALHLMRILDPPNVGCWHQA